VTEGEGIGTFPTDWADAIGPAASPSALRVIDAAISTERSEGQVVFAPA
jgi:hypothetical protein